MQELLSEGVKGRRTRFHDRSFVHVQRETILYMDLRRNWLRSCKANSETRVVTIRQGQ